MLLMEVCVALGRMKERGRLRPALCGSEAAAGVNKLHSWKQQRSASLPLVFSCLHNMLTVCSQEPSGGAASE